MSRERLVPRMRIEGELDPYGVGEANSGYGEPDVPYSGSFDVIPPVDESQLESKEYSPRRPSIFDFSRNSIHNPFARSMSRGSPAGASPVPQRSPPIRRSIFGSPQFENIENKYDDNLRQPSPSRSPNFDSELSRLYPSELPPIPEFNEREEKPVSLFRSMNLGPSLFEKLGLPASPPAPTPSRLNKSDIYMNIVNGNLLQLMSILEDSKEQVDDKFLEIAIMNGQLNIVRYLMEERNLSESIGVYNAMRHAAHRGHYNVVRYLIENTNVPIQYIVQMFWDAVQSGRMNIVEYLSLFNGIQNPDILNIALKLASLNGHSEIVKFLLLKGADALNDALHAIINSGRFDPNIHSSVALELLQKGADINAAFERVLYLDDVNLFRFLLDKFSYAISKRNKEKAIKEARENIRQFLVNSGFIKKEEYGTCAICYDEMDSSQAVQRLGCGHIFHQNCISNWMIKSNTCPLCRTPIRY